MLGSGRHSCRILSSFILGSDVTKVGPGGTEPYHQTLDLNDSREINLTLDEHKQAEPSRAELIALV